MRISPGHVKAAANMIRANRWRSLMTMFGVIVGVASVIVIIGISEGVKNTITSQVNNYSKNVITITSSTTGSTSFGVSSGPSVSTLTPQDVSAVGSVKGVQTAVPLSIVSGTVSGDQVDPKAVVMATSEDLPTVLNQSVAYGNFFTNEDSNVYSAVLGASAAKALFHDPVPLGLSFSWHNQQFIVDGVLNSFSATPFSNNTLYNNAVFIPEAAAKQLVGNSVVPYEILAKVHSGRQLNSVDRAINSKLLDAHAGQHDFAVLLPDQVAQNSTSILNLMTELIIGIAAVALFVGGVGIMNVMLVSVTERMHEIGIRKAIGASNRQILSQFLVEAIAVSITGGIIGIIVALLIDLGLRVFTDLTPVLNWQVIVITTLLSVIIGVVFGMIPAYRASRKQPIEALRND